MAELFGKAAGVSGGRGGSMHLFDRTLRLFGGYGIVGGQIPPATGAALALTYRGSPGPDAEAVMCVLGDGTTNIGAFHESLNLAGLWQLPIVYVIVNNGLGMGTPVEKAAAEPDLYKRGCSYRISGERVDGDDVVAVRDAARAASDKRAYRASARSDRGRLPAASWPLGGGSGQVPLPRRGRAAAQARPRSGISPAADRGRRPGRQDGPGHRRTRPRRRSTPPWNSPTPALTRVRVSCSTTSMPPRSPMRHTSLPGDPVISTPAGPP